MDAQRTCLGRAGGTMIGLPLVKSATAFTRFGPGGMFDMDLSRNLNNALRGTGWFNAGFGGGDGDGDR